MHSRQLAAAALTLGLGFGAAGEEVVLDPGEDRGRSIGHDSLLPGDIVVTMGESWLSKAISGLTGSEVSHGILFVGGPGCEDSEEGDDCFAVHAAEVLGEFPRARVQLGTMREILWEHGYTLAVAFRVPGLSLAQREAVADYAREREGKPFDVVGLVSNAGYLIPKALCGLLGIDGETKAKCLEGTLIGRLPEKIADADAEEGFYCTELIFEAFSEAAGIEFVRGGRPEASEPGDVPRLERRGDLEYVGHLIGG